LIAGQRRGKNWLLLMRSEASTFANLRRGTLHVLQIIASLDNAAAGPSYSVSRLAEALAGRGLASEIVCTNIAPSAHVPVHTFPHDGAALPLLGKLYVSRSLSRAVGRAAAEGAVLHSHGLWTMPNLYPASAARRHRAVHIISPRGMLGPAALRFSQHQKQLVWWLVQRRAVESATCLHATSRQEFEELRALGLKNPVAIVPNGIDLPDAADIRATKSRRDPHRRTLLHLGRIHPKKGIDRLIEAWAHLEPLFPDWRLRIVGPSEGGHREKLAARAVELGLARATFDGAIFGASKAAVYQEADLFVLPTLNENFGMVVAEALSNGTPVISTKGAPWAGLDREGAGWWIDHGVGALEEALNRAMTMPAIVLDEMGIKGRRWMAAEFSWDKIAADMEQVYRWCLRSGEPPEVVERPS